MSQTPVITPRQLVYMALREADACRNSCKPLLFDLLEEVLELKTARPSVGRALMQSFLAVVQDYAAKVDQLAEAVPEALGLQSETERSEQSGTDGAGPLQTSRPSPSLTSPESASIPDQQTSLLQSGSQSPTTSGLSQASSSDHSQSSSSSSLLGVSTSPGFDGGDNVTLPADGDPLLAAQHLGVGPGSIVGDFSFLAHRITHKVVEHLGEAISRVSVRLEFQDGQKKMWTKVSDMGLSYGGPDAH